MCAVPAAAHAVPDFPLRFRGRSGNHGTDDFVAGDAGKGGEGAEVPGLEGGVGVADAAGEDFDEDFA